MVVKKPSWCLEGSKLGKELPYQLANDEAIGRANTLLAYWVSTGE